MIDEPYVLTTQPRRAAVIHVTVEHAKIREVMGPGLAELQAALADQDIKPTGHWYTHHFSLTPETFDFEIGMPLDDAVFPTGRVRGGVFMGGKVARTIFRGDYPGLAGAWSELDAWISSHGLKPARDLWEVYLVGPEADPGPANWRTELSRPLLG